MARQPAHTHQAFGDALAVPGHAAGGGDGCGAPAGGAAAARVAEVIGVDLACIGCEYNLRYSSSGGRCPECEVPVARSMSRQRLIFADPTWLVTLSRGSAVALWSVIAVWPPLLLLLLMESLSSGGGRLWWSVQRLFHIETATAGVVHAGLLGCCLGQWWITSPPPEAEIGRGRRWRLLARALTLAAGLAVTVVFTTLVAERALEWGLRCFATALVATIAYCTFLAWGTRNWAFRRATAIVATLACAWLVAETLYRLGYDRPLLTGLTVRGASGLSPALQWFRGATLVLLGGLYPWMLFALGAELQRSRRGAVAHDRIRVADSGSPTANSGCGSVRPRRWWAGLCAAALVLGAAGVGRGFLAPLGAMRHAHARAARRGPATAFQSRLKQGAELLAAGRLAEAFGPFGDAIELCTDYDLPVARLMGGRMSEYIMALIDGGQPRLADELCVRLIAFHEHALAGAGAEEDSADPRNVELHLALCHLLRGKALLRLPDCPAAEQALRRAVALREKHYGTGPMAWLTANARSMLGEALSCQGQFDGAQALLTESYAVLDAAMGQPRLGMPRARLEEALQRIVRHFEAAGDAAATAAHWRQAQPSH